MSYQLGIDVGATFTAAAICRRDDRGHQDARAVSLGDFTVTVPSVLFLTADRQVVVGDAAERRALDAPDRVAREVPRRIGDDVPLVVGGESHLAQDLWARLVRWVVDRVTAREGRPPQRITVSHPAGWGRHKRRLVVTALRGVGLARVALVPESQAAALGHDAAARFPTGSTVAVYDLGGSGFDAAVLRKVGDGGFVPAGPPERIDRLGGVDVDGLVVAHVAADLRDELGRLDPADPHTVTAMAGLRRACVEAKVRLSTDSDAMVPAQPGPGCPRSRLSRSEFDAVLRPMVAQTVDALRRAVSAARIDPAELVSVLLVGGSSRIPLVARMVSEALGRPVEAGADPTTVVAVGAALTAGGSAERTVALRSVAGVHAATTSVAPAPVHPAASPTRVLLRPRRPVGTDRPGRSAEAQPVFKVVPAPSLEARRRPRRVVAAALVVAMLAVLVATVLMTTLSSPDHTAEVLRVVTAAT